MITSTTTARLPLPTTRKRLLSDDVEGYYRTLLRNLPWPGDIAGDPLRAIGVTSCTRGAGVSTVALHLAVTAAQSSTAQILLVDAHLTWPNLFRQLGVQAGPGLAELLLEELPVMDVVQPGPLPNLSVITSGGGCDEAAVFDAAALPEVVDTLKQSYDLVIVDLPPTNDASGALRLAGLLDGAVLVLEAERVHHKSAQRAKQLLQRAQGQLLGVVLNKFEQHIPNWMNRRL